MHRVHRAAEPSGAPSRRAGRRLAVVVVAVAMLGCGVRGNGQAASEAREVAAFTRIDLHGLGTLTWRRGPDRPVRLSGDANLLPLVRTEVRDGTLFIGPVETIRPRLPLQYTLQSPLLEGIEVTGAARATLEDVQAQRLRIAVSGAGKVVARGQANQLTVELSGAADIDALGLQADVVQVEVSGAGNVRVHARRELDARLSGTGQIRYAGNPPVVRSDVSGAGRIDPIAPSAAD